MVYLSRPANWSELRCGGEQPPPRSSLRARSGQKLLSLSNTARRIRRPYFPFVSERRRRHHAKGVTVRAHSLFRKCKSLNRAIGFVDSNCFRCSQITRLIENYLNCLSFQRKLDFKKKRSAHSNEPDRWNFKSHDSEYIGQSHAWMKRSNTWTYSS